jgi:DNA transposition AAA+ family ATPase
MDRKPGPDFLHNFGEDSRRLIAARMLPPMGHKLTDEQRRGVRTSFKAHVKKYGLSLKAIAKQVGCGESTISQWQNDKYPGDKDALTHKINLWMERDERMRDANADIPQVDMWVTQAMMRMIDVTCEMQGNLAMTCPSGSGKTMVLKVAADRRQGFYLYCDGNMRPRIFIKALCRAVFGVPKDKTLAGMMDELTNKLRDTNRCIMLDEAHLLCPSIFSLIRSIHDQAGVSFILAGTHKIIDAVDDRAGGEGQLFRRFITWNVTEHINNAGDDRGPSRSRRPLFSEKEIHKFLDHLPVKLSDSGFDMIWSIACLPGYGCLGTIKNILGMCYRKWGGDEIGSREITTVLKLFFGGKSQLITSDATKHIDTQRRKTA